MELAVTCEESAMVHCLGERWTYRQADGHAEQHDGQGDPAEANNVDEESELPERESGVLHHLPVSKDRDQDWQTIACG